MKQRYGKNYGERGRLLMNMGYQSYSEYLSSDTWSSIRKEVLEKRPSCELCSRRATQVHHAKYTLNSLQRCDSVLLVSICHPCHQYLELRPDDAKEPWSMVVNKLLCGLNRIGSHDRAREIAKGLGRIYTPSRYRGSPTTVSKTLMAASRSSGEHWKRSGKSKKRGK